jgi:hypothetical protein
VGRIERVQLQARRALNSLRCGRPTEGLAAAQAPQALLALLPQVDHGGHLFNRERRLRKIQQSRHGRSDHLRDVFSDHGVTAFAAQLSYKKPSTCGVPEVQQHARSAAQVEPRRRLASREPLPTWGACKNAAP